MFRYKICTLKIILYFPFVLAGIYVCGPSKMAPLANSSSIYFIDRWNHNGSMTRHDNNRLIWLLKNVLLSCKLFSNIKLENLLRHSFGIIAAVKADAGRHIHCLKSVYHNYKNEQNMTYSMDYSYKANSTICKWIS